jgi:hypothetical protein
MTKFRINMKEVKKQAARIRVNKSLKSSPMTYETAPQFIKDKIDKGRKMIEIAGLPG